ncbi:hypothetical protein BCP8-2_208 [Bacillus phage BCP8-2]|uniref:Uncharacterized protein n=1 Tax=Bacillus phage BCP8-2 TaxID=1129192 RepID=A0A0E3D9N5_9CAUD|nr:HNH endonuclease [Bacillus phage BCP8-2]AHJ87246.1 hypothetical protein BCP8-2_208 [Bacillus phage BCP8-2]
MKVTHGMTNSRLYNIYRNMKQRCHNPKNTNFDKYGGKGIEVCQEWRDSPSDFISWALRNGYTDELTIDRVDATKGYEPSNCRWITLSENSAIPNKGRKGNNGNGNTPVLIEYNGKTQSLKDWSNELGIPYKTLHRRVRSLGWSAERAFKTVVGGSK